MSHEDHPGLTRPRAPSAGENELVALRAALTELNAGVWAAGTATSAADRYYAGVRLDQLAELGNRNPFIDHPEWAGELINVLQTREQRHHAEFQLGRVRVP